MRIYFLAFKRILYPDFFTLPERTPGKNFIAFGKEIGV